MFRFSEKISSLVDTVSKFDTFDPTDLSAAIAASADLPVIAVGSGGSVVCAEFFKRCRDTMGMPLTLVQTPMEMTFDNTDVSGSSIWLFTASGSNADIIACAKSVLKRGAHSVHLLTRKHESPTGEMVQAAGGSVHVVPVADFEDGFLATHSMIATVLGLAFACECIVEASVPSDFLLRYQTAISQAISPNQRQLAVKRIAAVKPTDVVLLLADPQLQPVSKLIETSLWEAALLPVQSTDLRNFAHGRHTWLTHKGSDAVVLALSGADSHCIATSILNYLPSDLRTTDMQFGDCGRFSNVVGIVRGLVLIEAFGIVLGRDPGKPGTGIIGRPLYNDASLLDYVNAIDDLGQQKLAAMHRYDHDPSRNISIIECQNQFIDRFQKAKVGALVLDYDGTIVSTVDRFELPSKHVVAELERLHSEGMQIAIATGRGKSVGRDLRSSVTIALQDDIQVGYYNGGYIAPLSLDISLKPPLPHAELGKVALKVEELRRSFELSKVRIGPIQIVLEASDPASLGAVADILRKSDAFLKGDLRIVHSGHSIDIVPATSTKLNVVKLIKEQIRPELQILCVGDSGTKTGNDFELLTTGLGVSVDKVCGRSDGSWSLFGRRILGPDALVLILRALKPVKSGGHYLDHSALMLDKRQE